MPYSRPGRRAARLRRLRPQPHWQYHCCRNRHCPQCGARAKEAWLQDRLAEVLPVPYAHLVFTLPHSLNGLYGVHPRWVIDTLFASVAQTLSEFAANPR